MRALRLESGAEQLDDEHVGVAVDDEAGEAVAFAVHQSVRCRQILERRPSCDGMGEPVVPPGGIDDDVGVGLESSDRDFRRWTVECGAEFASAWSAHIDETGVDARRGGDVAAEDPGMSVQEAFGAARAERGDGLSDLCSHGAQPSACCNGWRASGP